MLDQIVEAVWPEVYKQIIVSTPQVNLAFGESSKLVVQQPAPPSPPEEFEVSTSFTSWYRGEMS